MINRGGGLWVVLLLVCFLAALRVSGLFTLPWWLITAPLWLGLIGWIAFSIGIYYFIKWLFETL